jgi:hypothetical protein
MKKDENITKFLLSEYHRRQTSFDEKRQNNIYWSTPDLILDNDIRSILKTLHFKNLKTEKTEEDFLESCNELISEEYGRITGKEMEKGPKEINTQIKDMSDKLSKLIKEFSELEPYAFEQLESSILTFEYALKHEDVGPHVPKNKFIPSSENTSENKTYTFPTSLVKPIISEKYKLEFESVFEQRINFILGPEVSAPIVQHKDPFESLLKLDAALILMKDQFSTIKNTPKFLIAEIRAIQLWDRFGGVVGLGEGACFNFVGAILTFIPPHSEEISKGTYNKAVKIFKETKKSSP